VFKKDQSMKYAGTIKSGYRFRIKATSAIIEFDIDESHYQYDFEWNPPYEFNILNEKGELFITSTTEEKSFFKRTIGIGGILFYHQKIEICRISDLNRPVFYDGNTYELKGTRDDLTQEFFTDDSHLKIIEGCKVIEFSFNKEYLLQCLCCGVYIWSRYVLNLS
jgi:hypothetical protein